MSPPDLHRFQTGSTIKNQKTKKNGNKNVYKNETKWHQLRLNKVKCLFFNLFFYKTADIFNVFLKFHSFDPKMGKNAAKSDFWVLRNSAEPLTSHKWPRQNFSLRYQYNIKQTSDENKEKYQVGDYRSIQYQILQITKYEPYGRE